MTSQLNLQSDATGSHGIKTLHSISGKVALAACCVLAIVALALIVGPRLRGQDDSLPMGMRPPWERLLTAHELLPLGLAAVGNREPAASETLELSEALLAEG